MKGLRELRMSRNLTQEEVAKALNISRSTVTMWELGEAMPRADKLKHLAKLLECTIEELLGGE